MIYTNKKREQNGLSRNVLSFVSEVFATAKVKLCCAQ